MTQRATAVPYGAQEIINNRMIGKRPADMVLVSLVGPLREVNPVVVAKPGRAYDWRFLARLEVLMVVSSAIDALAVRRVADAILAVQPSYFGIWFGDRQRGQHIAWGSYRPKAIAIRTMFAADRKMFSGIGSVVVNA